MSKGIPIETTFPPHMLQAMEELQQQQQQQEIKPEPCEPPPAESSSTSAMDEELEEGEIVGMKDNSTLKYL